MKEDINLKKSQIRGIISYLDQTGDEKITFNEFVVALTPISRAPKIEDVPDIINYSPRRTALDDSLAPKFDESGIATHRKSSGRNNKYGTTKSIIIDN